MLASGAEVLPITLSPELQSFEGPLRAAGFDIASSDAADARIVDDIAGPVARSSAVFSQSNPRGNEAMLAHVDAVLAAWAAKRGLHQAQVLELYAGSGNFTRVLCKWARDVVAVEGSAEAASLLRRLERPNVEVLTCSAEEALRNLLNRMGLRGQVSPPPGLPATDTDLEGGGRLLFVDPPREGLSEEVVRQIGALRPPGLIYVSCAPAAFARDVGRLAGQGLVLRRLRIFDLYPQTPHLELIAELWP